MKSITSIIILFSLGLFVFISCGDTEEPMELITDRFDRQVMLTDWADMIIIPALESYNSAVSQLVADKEAFVNDRSDDNLQKLREGYIAAYMALQQVSMFDIGKAEEIRLRNYTNIYPTDVATIDKNIVTQSYNLELPSNYDAQGFPALDYMLFGMGENNVEILSSFADDNTLAYLDDLVTRLHSLSEIVLEDWKSGYRATFINNRGASGTATVDKMVNDFLFYYEKFLRAGKIGIPAGVFSGNPISNAVEAPYSKIYSKALFLEAFGAVQDFFVGKSFDGNSQGESLESYLIYMQEQNNTADIASQILDQWTEAEATADQLSDNLNEQVITDNNKMLSTYDELQEAIVSLKVDMMQSLNIQVDYVDADGD